MSLSIAQMQLLQAFQADPEVAHIDLHGGEYVEDVLYSLHTRRMIVSEDDGMSYALTDYGLALLSLYGSGDAHVA